MQLDRAKLLGFRLGARGQQTGAKVSIPDPKAGTTQTLGAKLGFVDTKSRDRASGTAGQSDSTLST